MGSNISADLVNQQNRVVASLPKKEIRALSETTGLDPEKISEWHKQFYRDFPSGEIHEQEFRKFYCESFPGLNPVAFSERAFSLFDTNQDRVITFKEFLMGISQMESASTEGLLILSFRFYDIDNSGGIGIDEMEEMMVSLQRAMNRDTNVSEERARELGREMFTILDKSQDGKIEQSEFLHAINHNADLNKLFEELTGST